MKGKQQIIGALMATAGLMASVGILNAQETRALRINAENLMRENASHREVADRGGDADALQPGDVIQYTLVFTNTTDVPVRNVVFDNPMPQGLTYVPGSAGPADAEVDIAYSIDGGRTYSAQPMIQRMVDGVRANVAAPRDMYTHIRWTVRSWVQPDSTVTAEFQAQFGETPEPANENDGSEQS